MEENDMNDGELKTNILEQFANLQRIKNAEDRDAEIAKQDALLRAKMQALGLSTENLEQ